MFDGRSLFVCGWILVGWWDKERKTRKVIRGNRFVSPFVSRANEG